MKKFKIFCIVFCALMLLVGCGETDAEINDKVEFLEILPEGEEVKGLTYENEGGIWGKIIKAGDEAVTIKICKFIVDETAPNGCYIEETDDEKELKINGDVQVWVMHDASALNSRISYNDIDNYEKEKGIDVIWAFDLDDSGSVKYIYEPLIP